jgi:hypothetical protein
MNSPSTSSMPNTMTPGVSTANAMPSGGDSLPMTTSTPRPDSTASTGSASSSGMVTGLFPDRASAEAAYQSAHERGYTKDDVNLVMSDETRERHFKGEKGSSTELGNKAAEGAGIGGAIGGTVGAIAAAVAAIGSVLVLPGLGVVVAGPLAAAAAGAGAGAAGGGLLGALIGWSIPEERVKHYEDGIKQGGILMGLKTRNADDASHLENSWKQNRGEHVYR